MAFYEWELQWGPHLKAFLARAEKGKPPPPLLNRPQLQERDLPLLEMFRRLSRARRYGPVTPDPISIESFQALCDLRGITRRDVKTQYLEIIQTLDAAFLEHCREQVKKTSK